MGFKQDLIVALYGSIKMVLKEFIDDITVKFGEVIIEDSNTRPVKVEGCASLINIVGSVKGKILIDLPLQTALKISSVMNDEEFTEFDDNISMTMNELANMVVGNAINKLVDAGNKDADISVPSFLYGKEILVYSSEASDVITLPVETSYGNLFIKIVMMSR
jgi:CheY-specific phosphatase CheX